MKYSLDIRKSNIPCHLDLEKEITLKKNGLLTFTLRVNNNNIVDLNFTQYIDVTTYRAIKGITAQELFITFDN